MNIGRSVNYSKRVGLIAIKHLAYTKRFGHPPPPVCNMGFYAWLSNVDLALYIDKPNLLFLLRAYRKLGDESDDWYKQFWKSKGLKFTPDGKADLDDRFKQ